MKLNFDRQMIYVTKWSWKKLLKLIFTFFLVVHPQDLQRRILTKKPEGNAKWNYML